MATFGERLRAARERAGFTQEQLGLELGVGNAAVSTWENDQNDPKIQRLAALRKTLKISLDELICGDDVAASQNLPHQVRDDGYVLPGPRPSLGTRDYVIAPATRNIASNAQEDMLLARFRSVTQAKRNAILELLKAGK